MHDHHDGADTSQTGFAAIVGVAVAVVCCAAAPLLVAVASSLALGAVLGVGAGVVALVALTALAIGARRRRTPAVSPQRKDTRA
jgi:hypothetical protein